MDIAWYGSFIIHVSVQVFMQQKKYPFLIQCSKPSTDSYNAKTKNKFQISQGFFKNPLFILSLTLIMDLANYGTFYGYFFINVTFIMLQNDTFSKNLFEFLKGVQKWPCMKIKKKFNRKYRFEALKKWHYSKVPYESPILSQLLDLISPPKINISEPRFKSYDPWDMANWPATVL